MFYPELRRILRTKCADILIDFDESSFEDDTQNVSDFTLKYKCGHVACRVRNTSMLNTYQPEMTIRAFLVPSCYSGPDGRNTEYRKIFEQGKGKYYLFGYGQIVDGRPTLDRYYFSDLDPIRCSCLFQDAKEIDNHDGTGFKAVPFSKLIEWHAVLKSSEPLPYETALEKWF